MNERLTSSPDTHSLAHSNINLLSLIKQLSFFLSSFFVHSFSLSPLENNEEQTNKRETRSFEMNFVPRSPLSSHLKGDSHDLSYLTFFSEVHTLSMSNCNRCLGSHKNEWDEEEKRKKKRIETRVMEG